MRLGLGFEIGVGFRVRVGVWLPPVVPSARYPKALREKTMAALSSSAADSAAAAGSCSW